MHTMRFRPAIPIMFVAVFLTPFFTGCKPRPAEIVKTEEPAAASKAAEQAYRVEEVFFRAGDNLLAGTLYLPQTPGPHPAIAMVLGSGPRDRNYGGASPALGRHF